MRDLCAGFQCEYMEAVPQGNRKRCLVKHHERINGKPQQLLPIKDGNKTRFMCKNHAQWYTPSGTTRKQKKVPAASEQETLL